MAKTISTGPKDVFLFLMMIGTLYVGVVSFINLIFDYINIVFPDPLTSYYQGSLDSIRWASAMLVVVFPVYLLLSWVIAKDYKKNPEKREMRVRKWLVYLTLFIAAVTIVGDLITLVYNFYSGELTTRFILKIVTVLLVAGSVFGFYLWDLHQNKGKSKIPSFCAVLASLVIFGGLAGGFLLVGTPGAQRLVRFDDQRVNDLSTIQYQIMDYWNQKEVLPENLEALRNSISGFVPPMDPQSLKPYEYRVTAPLQFELCAVFSKPNPDQRFRGNTDYTLVKEPTPIGYMNDPYSQQWAHGEGRVCFTRTIDPQLMKRTY